ncbi:gluconeogenesis factor YvcK family protein [Desulfurivibrio dismutans]|uniref:gluconeogenesis factor YvcK family protein n=1 Tax=Desulfurivibrio dismutans TaxID=1398908 RepID=UPI0023DB0D16|nr:gluconeogenesis factor YvcK family protein [Desulfurivibrio alkaliphilus]MDF1615507.1 YvcK family protein [Desulfurivibrio alkaliphilus]
MITAQSTIERQLAQLAAASFHPLDLMPYQDQAEKLLALVLNGLPTAPPEIAASLAELAESLRRVPCAEAKVLVFGGGTGLSNIIGGDSRHPGWPAAPFTGLKQLFPRTRAVVCVTDDGGSTGELLKDLPLIAVGDLRHVLLSSVSKEKLQKQYELTEDEAMATVARLHRLFNHRFKLLPDSPEAVLAQCGVKLAELPTFMERSLYWLLAEIFNNEHLHPLRQRAHCLGNLLLVAAIYQQPAMDRPDNPAGPVTAERRPAAPEAARADGEALAAVGKEPAAVEPPPAAVLGGLRFLADMLGAQPDAVLPCTTTPATLKIRYDNGVLVSGESKSAQAGRRCPVDRVYVEFSRQPEVPPEVFAAIAEADIILFAPGSLFTSIIPVLQVPGLAAAVRNNRRALKVLLSNLWVQAGETDLVAGEGDRRYHVSDLLRAYDRNIPGGIAGLFQQTMVVGMREIPGSILQNYALEGKVPIYLDRERVRRQGVAPIEAAIASQSDFDGSLVLQHDPAAVATAVRVLWGLQRGKNDGGKKMDADELSDASTTESYPLMLNPRRQTPDHRWRQMRQRLRQLKLAPQWQPVLAEILWRHRDILLAHLDYVAGLQLVPVDQWRRCQEWDNVFSFYEPGDRTIRVRADISPGSRHFEIAFLVALGQSLLGNYAAAKEKSPVMAGSRPVGYIFSLTMQPDNERRSFFTTDELVTYLELARMCRAGREPTLFTRVVNGNEGFTPPGLLFGLTYAWYLDNRFAPHIEYKMSITGAETSDLVPEQLRISARRQGLIEFFRQRVFRQ